MTILVTYASKHGATQGVAEHVAQILRLAHREVDVAPVTAVVNPAAFEAVVLGSAVYFGSWMKDAVEFVQRNRSALSTLPVWFFSCGPLGVEVKDEAQQPKDIDKLQAEVGARGQAMFYGALDSHKLSFRERMAVKAVRAPEGDFRDWEAIESWAQEIARTLAVGEAAAREAQPGVLVTQP
ncbi:MAG TPA: flavodoxin domain-containing protein [Ktedonobacterales bacterium]|jgi:menaquinone-dependent protoporphyrinogen oxidase|nr:flavodoxin domain-containing protein [Ktedonobacterales bacterium]